MVKTIETKKIEPKLKISGALTVPDDRDQRAKIENLRRALRRRCWNIRRVRIPAPGDQLSRVLLPVTSVLSAIPVPYAYDLSSFLTHHTRIGLLSFLSSGEEKSLSLSFMCSWWSAS
jgi:hypothetical protein